MKMKMNTNVIWREIENEAVIMHVDNSNYYTLNDIGTSIWKMIGAQKSFEDITRVICNEYDADREQVAKDIKALLRELEKESLIELSA